MQLQLHVGTRVRPPGYHVRGDGMSALGELTPRASAAGGPSVLRGRRLQLLLLVVTAASASYARFVVGPIQETMRAALSLSDNQMALLQGPALAFPVVIAAIPLGLAIDRHSRVRLLLIFALLDIVGTFLTALTTNFHLLFAARCLVGLTATSTSIAAYSLLADLYKPAERGRASMVVAVGEVVGASAAFALGGELVTMFGFGNGWRWAVGCLGIPLLPAILSMSGLREPPRTDFAMEQPSVREAISELWGYRSVISVLLVGRVIVGIADGAALIWAAPTLSRSYQLTPDRTGSIMGTVLLISGVLGPLVGGMLADHCQRSGGPRKTVTVLMWLALLSVPAGLFPFMPAAASSSVLLVCLVSICDAILVMVVPVTTVVIPNELRGLCMSLLFGCGVLFGVGLAPVTVSLLSGATGGPTKIGAALGIVCVATSVVGAATFAYGRRYLPP